MSDGNLHKGHRQRMMKKFVNNGLGALEDHEILEMVLYHIYPRRNTNDISHRLINTFGSIKAVFEASHKELTTVEGVGENAANQILFWGEFAGYLHSQAPEKVILNSEAAIIEYCRAVVDFRSKECVIALFLDNKFHLLSNYTVSDGTYNSVSFLTKEIAEKAIKCGCSSVVFVHSHPNDLPIIPSTADVVTTRILSDFLKKINIKLNDHIIIGLNSDYSMRSSELLKDIWS